MPKKNSNQTDQPKQTLSPGGVVYVEPWKIEGMELIGYDKDGLPIYKKAPSFWSTVFGGK